MGGGTIVTCQRCGTAPCWVEDLRKRSGMLPRQGLRRCRFAAGYRAGDPCRVCLPGQSYTSYSLWMVSFHVTNSLIAPHGDVDACTMLDALEDVHQVASLSMTLDPSGQVCIGKSLHFVQATSPSIPQPKHNPVRGVYHVAPFPRSALHHNALFLGSRDMYQGMK